MDFRQSGAEESLLPSRFPSTFWRIRFQVGLAAIIYNMPACIQKTDPCAKELVTQVSSAKTKGSSCADPLQFRHACAEEVVFVRNCATCPRDGFRKVRRPSRMQQSEARSFPELLALVVGHCKDRASHCTSACRLEVLRLMSSLTKPQILEAFPQLVCRQISQPHRLDIMT